MIVWKQIPAKEAEVRTRIILEIVAGALRRKRDEKQRGQAEPAPDLYPDLYPAKNCTTKKGSPETR